MLSVIFLFFVAAVAVMFFDFGGGLNIAQACSGDVVCNDPTHGGGGGGGGSPDLTPLWIFLGVLAVCGVLVLVMVIRNKNANKEYKKRQKKKEMKREAREEES